MWFERKTSGYKYLERVIAQRIAESQRAQRGRGDRIPHPALKAALVVTLTLISMTLFLRMCLGI